MTSNDGSHRERLDALLRAVSDAGLRTGSSAREDALRDTEVHASELKRILYDCIVAVSRMRDSASESGTESPAIAAGTMNVLIELVQGLDSLQDEARHALRRSED